LGGTLSTAAQPNITTVGNLSTLAVGGNVSAGNLKVATGETQLGQLKVRSFTVVVPSGVNSSIGICEILANGYHAELNLVGGATKSYSFAPSSAMGAGVFNGIIPFVCNSPSENVVVEINYTNVSAGVLPSFPRPPEDIALGVLGHHYQGWYAQKHLILGGSGNDLGQ
jgi:hypothetical protein